MFLRDDYFARGASCHHNQFGFDCYGIVELPYFRSVRPQILISGIRYDFTPAVARERNYNPVHFVVTVEPVVHLQTALALRGWRSGVLSHASSPSG